VVWGTSRSVSNNSRPNDNAFLVNLDSYGLSLNVSPIVGTRESAVLSMETRLKMSDSHLGKLSTISEEKWAVIRAKAKEAWANESSNSKRREAISTQHGRAVVILDPDKNVIEEFVSQIKAAEHLGVERRVISRRIASEALLDSKIGPVYIQYKAADTTKSRAIKVQVLDSNKNLIEVCASLRAAGLKYNIPVSTLSTNYLDKDRLCKNRYYFVSLAH